MKGSRILPVLLCINWEDKSLLLFLISVLRWFIFLCQTSLLSRDKSWCATFSYAADFCLLASCPESHVKMHMGVSSRLWCQGGAELRISLEMFLHLQFCRWLWERFCCFIFRCLVDFIKEFAYSGAFLFLRCLIVGSVAFYQWIASDFLFCKASVLVYCMLHRNSPILSKLCDLFV
jgi:hypothetical protein